MQTQPKVARYIIGSHPGHLQIVGSCKGCDPYGQLLCGILQVPSAVHTLHTHSIAAHRRRTGVYNIPVTIKWLGQRLCYGLVQTFGCS